MKKPNIILITSDQLRRNSLGFMGCQEVHTPHLDKIASDSIIFERCYTTNPVCMPARASILTGQYPDVHGVRRNGIEVPDKEYGIARVLIKYGYYTGFVGKTHFCPLHNQFDKSFRFHNWRIGSDYYGFIFRMITHDLKDYKTEFPPYPYGRAPQKDDSRIYNLDDYADWIKKYHPEYYPLAICDGYSGFHKGQPPDLPELWVSELPVQLHQSVWIMDQSLNFIDKVRHLNQPFFLWISFVDPHHPFNIPQQYLDMYDETKFTNPIYDEKEFLLRSSYHKERSKINFERYWKPNDQWRKYRKHYYGMITLIDEQIGRLFNELKTNGLLENTIIIFTADHGEMLGDHALERKGLFHYEQLINIPLFIYSPNLRSFRIKSICQLVEIPATILDLCNIPIPPQYQGISLVPWLKGKDTPIREAAIITNSGEGPLYSPWPELKTLVTERWKLNHYILENHFEIDDLENSPDETKPIDPNKNANLLKELLTQMNKYTTIYTSFCGRQIGSW